LFYADGADERRQDHGNENEGGEKTLAGIEITVGEEGEGKRNGGGEDGAVNGHLHGVPKTLEVNGIAENLEEIVEGEPAAGLTESAAEGLPIGSRKKKKKKSAVSAQTMCGPRSFIIAECGVRSGE